MINKITLGLFSTNSYLYEYNDELIIIDPNDKKIVNYIKRPSAIILTHEHIDHVAGISQIIKTFGEIPIFCSLETKNILTSRENLIRQTNKIDPRLSSFYQEEIDFITNLDYKVVKNNDKIFNLLVLETKGHSNGSICLVGDSFIFCGDLIFKDGYGRYDLEGGDYYKLKESINKIKALDKKLILYPGHGESTTISYTQQHLYL